MKAISLFLFLFSILNGTAQVVVIQANDPDIRYDLISPGHGIMKYTEFDSTGNKILTGESNNYVIVDKNGGQIMLIRSTKDETAHTFYIDTSVINISPVSMHSLDLPPHKELQVKFEPTTVIVKSIINGTSENHEYPMKKGYFDDNILVDIMGYFPIKRGIKYNMEGYRFESVKTKCVSAYEAEYLYDDYLKGTNGEYYTCKMISFKNDYISEGYAWFDNSSRKLMKLLVKLRKTKSSFIITVEWV